MNKEFIGNLMNINFLCWAFYYVNGGSKVDVNVSQLMHCLIYYNNLTSFCYYQPKDKVNEKSSLIFQE
jgi:hypothetical protein